VTAIDTAILLAFVLYSVATGLAHRRRASSGLDEYFLAGRSLSGWAAGTSMAATQFAADTPLLVTGLIATGGIFALWRLWIYAIAFLLLGFVLAPSWRRAAVLTDAELSELRYSGRAAALLRALKAIYFGTVFNCVVLAMVLFAAREITQPFLLWSRWLPGPVFDSARALVEAVGVPLARAGTSANVWTVSTDNAISIFAIVGVTLLYSTTGGLRSVVRTDVVQFVIMMAATIAYAWVVVGAAGGLAGIHDTLVRRYADASPVSGLTAAEILAFTPSRAKDASFLLLTLFGLQWLVQMNADGTGYLAQRAMACRSDRDATRSAVVFTVLQILVRSLLWLPLGLGLLVLFPPDPTISPSALIVDRESTFVRGMAELLPPGLRGLMLTGMLAALASTVDTHLNWGASYWTNDLFRRFFCEAWLGRAPSERALVWVARVSNTFILAIALFVMTRLSSIQTAWHASLLLGAGMGVMLLLRWFWWRINAWGELAAIATSAALSPCLLLTLPEGPEALRLLLVALLSTAAGVAAALATAPEPAEQLCAFYRRAHPPGFWGPVSAQCGEEPRAGIERLTRGIGATACAAFSVFSMLVACGTLLVFGTPPTWCPQRSTWVACLLVTASATALAAYRLSRRRP